MPGRTGGLFRFVLAPSRLRRRDNSEDSRFWGFVPMDHVVGKAILIYFSWDKEEGLPRFGRLFHTID